MRGGKNNPRCQCCNDDTCDGFRTREKNQWKKEAQEGLNPSFTAFDELVYTEPYVIKVSPEEYDKIQKLIDAPPKFSQKLHDLLNLAVQRDKSQDKE